MIVFDQAFTDLIKLEGGYSNNPLDVGGETYKGITRRFNADWKGWAIIDSYNIKFGSLLKKDQNLQALVKEFYKMKYWDAMQLDQVARLSSDVAYQLFQCGANQGIVTTVKMLQRALNCFPDLQLNHWPLKVDGIIGEQTMHILYGHVHIDEDYQERPYVLTMLKSQQCLRYMEIVEKDPKQVVFLKGWLARIK